MLDFPQKLPILDLTKTLRVWSGFTVGFGFLPGFSSKVGFGFRSGKNSQGRGFVGFGLDPLHHYCTVYLRWLKSQNVCEFFYMFYAEYIYWQIIRKKVELIELSCDYYLKIHVLLENFKPLWKSLQEP